ncbi:MAG: fibronectin type III domain-containing protein [Candidatus Nanopelagicales bacterium]
MRRALALCLTTLVTLGIGVPATQAAAEPLVNEDQWHRGSVGFNTYFTCIFTCQSYTVAFTKLNYQGPPASGLNFRVSSPTGYPKVGQRFYLHSYVSNIYPGSSFDNERYQMRLLLPTGLVPDIRTANDVVCTITDTSFTYTRDMAGWECLDPVRNGVYWQFPPVALATGESANFWVPVRATRSFTNETMQLTATMTPNSAGLLPNPVLSQNQVRVNPAVPGAPGKPVARSSAGRQVSLSWTAAAPNGAPVTYLVQRKVGTAWNTVATTTTRTWARAVSGNKGATVAFRIRPRNSAGLGPASPATSVVLK